MSNGTPSAQAKTPVDYYTFNKQVLSKFEEKIGSFEQASLILLDCGITPLPKVTDIPKKWSELLKGKSFYFGMIAIQTGVAFERVNDESHTSRAFNPRLCDKLASKLDYENNQDEIYDRFGEWCRKNNISVFLPKSRFGSGRYVQYPLSLALLDGEDQKELKRCFAKEGFSAYGDLDKQTFWDKLDNSLPKRIKNKQTQLEEKRDLETLKKSQNDYAEDLLENLESQIYSIYLRWDGLYTEDDRSGEKKRAKIREQQPFYFMELDCEQDNPEVSFYDNDTSLKELPQKITDGSFFVQDETYTAIWHLSRTEDMDLAKINMCAYVSKETTNISGDIQKSEREYKYGDLNIRILSKEQMAELAEKHEDLFGKMPTILLEGGIKLPSEGMPCWMKGAGPIMKPQNFKEGQKFIWLENIDAHGPGKPIEIDKQGLTSLDEGKYAIRFSADCPAILFEIKKFDRKDDLCRGGGWIGKNGNFTVCGEDSTRDVCGLDFSGVKCLHECDVVRRWMDLAVGKNPKPCANENVIHKVLRRAENGTGN